MSIPKFLEYLELEKNYSPRTVLSYRTDLEEFQQFYQSETGDENIEKAEKLHIRNFLMHLSKTSVSDRSINRKISAFKTYYKYLLKIAEIEVSPVSGIKTLKQYNKVQIPFSEKELQALFQTDGIFSDNFTGLRDRMILDMLYQTGMRRAELIGLKMNDVDFSLKQIRVTGKRDKERIIPISDELAQNLRHYIKERRKNLPENEQDLFLTERGKPLYDKLVYNLVNSYLGLVSTKDKKSPHILRHSFATHLLNHGAELNAVKELLGHSSLAATQVYTHGSIEQLKKVFNKAHPREQKKPKNYDSKSSDN